MQPSLDNPRDPQVNLNPLTPSRIPCDSVGLCVLSTDRVLFYTHSVVCRHTAAAAPTLYYLCPQVNLATHMLCVLISSPLPALPHCHMWRQTDTSPGHCGWIRTGFHCCTCGAYSNLSTLVQQACLCLL